MVDPSRRCSGSAERRSTLTAAEGFTSYSDAELRRRSLASYQAEGFLRSRSRLAEAPETMTRVRFAREVLGPDVELFVDANGAYGPRGIVRGECVRPLHGVSCLVPKSRSLPMTWWECASSGSASLRGSQWRQGRVRLHDSVLRAHARGWSRGRLASRRDSLRGHRFSHDSLALRGAGVPLSGPLRANDSRAARSGIARYGPRRVLP